MVQWIWKWRCSIAFGRDEEVPLDTRTFLHRQFVLTKKALDRFDILIPRQGAGRMEVHVRWTPPPYTWVLLNTDGAAKGNPGLAGCGGLFQHDTGNLYNLFGFYRAVGICSAMRAELLALAIGLEEASRLGYRKLLIQMDNSACVSLIKNEELISNNGLRSLVYRCKEMIANFNGAMYLDHCYCEANGAANWLANKGVNGVEDLVLLNLFPIELCSILRDDVTGVAFPRIIAT